MLTLDPAMPDWMTRACHITAYDRNPFIETLRRLEEEEEMAIETTGAARPSACDPSSPQRPIGVILGECRNQVDTLLEGSVRMLDQINGTSSDKLGQPGDTPTNGLLHQAEQLQTALADLQHIQSRLIELL